MESIHFTKEELDQLYWLLASNQLASSYSPNFQLIVEKLDEKNFQQWAQSIKLVIDSKGKLGYLTGESTKLIDAAALQKWKLENSMVTAWLINSMKPFIGKTYHFLPTAKDVWDVVRETYSNAENFS